MDDDPIGRPEFRSVTLKHKDGRNIDVFVPMQTVLHTTKDKKVTQKQSVKLVRWRKPDYVLFRGRLFAAVFATNDRYTEVEFFDASEHPVLQQKVQSHVNKPKERL